MYPMRDPADIAAEEGLTLEEFQEQVELANGVIQEILAEERGDSCLACGNPVSIRHGLCAPCRDVQRTVVRRRIRRESRRSNHRFKRRGGVDQ